MIVENLLQQLSQIGFLAQLLVFTIENGILLLMAVLIGKIIEPKNTVLNIKDRKWVISTLICNILVTSLGFKLYQLQVIQIDFSTSFVSSVTDTLLLIILMDFFMFCFHYLAHTLKWFYPIHKLHHTHINTNVYSLFVLHPIETLGFGFIWLILISATPSVAVLAITSTLF